MSMSEEKEEIIVIKKKKAGGHGHHGGAWKIAYADFVTAMMAFFLLMWLLNSTSEEQKRGIADFFAPVSVFESEARSGGKMGSKNVTVEGAFDGRAKPNQDVSNRPGAPVNAADDINTSKDSSVKDSPLEEQPMAGAQIGENSSILDNSLESSNSPSSIIENQFDPLARQEVISESDNEYVDEVDGNSENNQDKVKADDLGEETDKELELREKLTEEKIIEEYRELEDQAFEKAEEELREAIKEKGLEEFSENIVMEKTEEGLRIQLIDKQNRPLFPSGSARMKPFAVQLLGEVSKVILKMQKQVSIAGHTDAKPYALSRRYTNWELSADRANDSRKHLMYFDVPEALIQQVVGKAAKEPYIKADPFDPQNRRISITLLREDSGEILRKPRPVRPKPKPKPENKSETPSDSSYNDQLIEELKGFQYIPQSQ